MKAVSITEHGGPEVLKWVESEDPTPAAGEVVIDVVASALNRADVMQRWRLYPDGRVKLVVERTVPLADAAEGHRLVEAGGHLGKILLVNDENA
ncbi:zinc-binding dehydrogenase [Streptomyces antibioticus]|uniref:zinc-binding dehydrogenase n=1 Tax=Streptomyces antibioticus TaxID=1890 RepID=UPI0033BB84D8